MRTTTISTLPGRRGISVLSGFVGLGLCAISTTSHAAVTFEDIIPGDATVEKIATGFGFAEAPAWSPDGFLLFCDVDENRVVRLNPDGSTEDFLNPSGGTSGLVFDTRGNLYLCQSGVDSSGTPYDCLGSCRQVSTLPKDGSLEVLVGSFNAKPLNSPNDLALDGAGGIYFTDPRYGSLPIEQEAKGVYYIDVTGETRRVISDLPMPNGILVSNDGRRLYVAELNQALTGWGIRMYPILSPGELGEGTKIFDPAALDGPGPDGMAMDEHGNLYGTFMRLEGWGGGNQIIVFDPEGEILGRIPVPEVPANCGFGGDDGKTLFIAARTSLYAINTKVRGAPLRSLVPLLATVVHSSPNGSGTSAEPIARVSFSKSMDRASVEAAFSVSPSMAGTFEWSNLDRALTFRPDAPWPLAGELSFRLSGDVRDATGATFDGNANQVSEGSPADDYEWTFTFLPPVIESFRPVQGEVGQLVRITGTRFSEVTNVRFGEVEASFSHDTRFPDIYLKATVPVGATTSPIEVESPAGVRISAEAFVVVTPELSPLQCEKRNASVIALTWPISADAVLEMCSDLSSPNWSPVPGTPVTVGINYELEVDLEPGHRFYRLRSP